MKKHNFNFANVSILKTIPENKQAIISTYTIVDNVIKSNINIPEDLKSLIDKNNISLFHNGIYYSFVYLKDSSKNIEKAVSKALSEIPKNITEIVISTDLVNIKKFVSTILVENSNKWTAKTEEEILTQKNIFIVQDTDVDLSLQLQKGIVLAEAMATKIRLIDMPANYLTPKQFWSEAFSTLDIHNNKKVKMTAISGKILEEEGYGAIYAVSKGSSKDGYLITIKYNGGEPEDKPIVLVGKGLTFDSGGISIKPSKGMGRMKGDMGGAATVIASILYAIKTGAKKNIVGIIAACENMPDGNALKPGDVITAKNGKTIEVEDTDAEGRLVLADALCHAQTFNGSMTIDFATLTGAVISAIGHVHTGLFTENDSLSSLFEKAGKAAGDTVWRLPLSDDYSHFLESSVADMNNLCLGQGAGATNGAIFLREFAPKENWVHLDIAGTSDHNGATGRPVSLISELLD